MKKVILNVSIMMKLNPVNHRMECAHETKLGLVALQLLF